VLTDGLRPSFNSEQYAVIFHCNATVICEENRKAVDYNGRHKSVAINRRVTVRWIFRQERKETDRRELASLRK